MKMKNFFAYSMARHSDFNVCGVLVDVRRLSAVILVTALAGCGSVSKGIDDKGGAQQVVFPDPSKDATQPEGSFPNVENLRKVQVGLSKSQLYGLLGPPHFQEGFVSREWDYIFQLGGASNVKACQFKVLFDRNLRIGGMHWQDENCAALASSEKLRN